MDQKELKALEYGCIQEEPPECTAACPIHVDVRAFTGKVASGAWGEAWKVLTRTMPVPDILARICDHPCEAVCKRNAAGGAIAIAALERACAQRPHTEVKPLIAPQKALRVAVVGCALSGLVAAWDLLQKGYRVTIFEAGDDPGAAFGTFPEEVLPRSVIDGQIAALRAMGVDLRTGEAVVQAGWLEQLALDFDAVYVALDTDQLPSLPADARGQAAVDAATLATPAKGVFAGGRKREVGSPIRDAADGRRAAVSIDRFLQNVSMTAARENEGPVATRLYTNIEDVQAEPPVAGSGPQGMYTDEEAMREAGRCIQCQCMECVKKCLYLERFKGYPKRYFREIYNSETIVLGARGRSNRLINHCSLCIRPTARSPSRFRAPWRDDIPMPLRQHPPRRCRST